jgi:hypothetical protein
MGAAPNVRGAAERLLRGDGLSNDHLPPISTTSHGVA